MITDRLIRVWNDVTYTVAWWVVAFVYLVAERMRGRRR